MTILKNMELLVHPLNRISYEQDIITSNIDGCIELQPHIIKGVLAQEKLGQRVHATEHLNRPEGDLKDLEPINDIVLDFNKYMMRYGEFGVQDIIERLERAEGIHSSIDTSLEDRWNYLMQIDYSQQRLAA